MPCDFLTYCRILPFQCLISLQYSPFIISTYDVMLNANPKCWLQSFNHYSFEISSFGPVTSYLFICWHFWSFNYIPIPYLNIGPWWRLSTIPLESFDLGGGGLRRVVDVLQVCSCSSKPWLCMGMVSEFGELIR